MFVVWHSISDDQSRRPSAKASVAACVLRFRLFWGRQRSVASGINKPEISPPYCTCLSIPLGSTPEPSQWSHTRSVSVPQPCRLDRQVVFHTRNLRILVNPSGDNIQVREDVRVWKTKWWSPWIFVPHDKTASNAAAARSPAPKQDFSSPSSSTTASGSCKQGQKLSRVERHLQHAPGMPSTVHRHPPGIDTDSNRPSSPYRYPTLQVYLGRPSDY